MPHRSRRAYARDGDPVGAWYEGGEPGRESFCVRDVSQHVLGGHALGTGPRRVDYEDDARFWYCLAANFGRPMKAAVEQSTPGRTISPVRATLGAGGSATVEIP